MSDLIERQDAIDAVLEFFVEFLGGAFHEDDQKILMKRMNELPSAEPERKKGKWIFHIDDLFPEESTQECSVCHEEESIKIQNDKFCPNCGADMRGEEDEYTD